MTAVAFTADEQAQAEAAEEALIALARAGDVNAAIELMMTDQRPDHPNRGKLLRQSAVHIEWQRLWDEHRRIVLWAPPESGKTTAIVARIVCALGRNPMDSTAYFSANEDLPRRVVGEVKAHIESNPIVHRIWPELRPGPKWTDTELHVWRAGGRDPSLVATSIGGNITGLHPNRIICDDVLIWKNARSPSERKNVLDWIDSNAVSGRLSERGQIVLVNQAYHPDDAAHVLAKRPGWVSRAYPVVDAAGRPTFPDLWPAARIEDKREHTTPLEFARQMMCQPYDESEARFKREWIEEALERGDGRALVDRIDEKPTGPDANGVAKPVIIRLGVDLGWIASAHSDETVIFVEMEWPNEDTEPLCIEAGRWPAPEILNRIESAWLRYQADAVIVENVAGQDLLVQMLRGRTAIPVIPYRTGSSKAHPEFGVEGMALEFSNGKKIIPNRGGVAHPQIKKWIEEMLFYSPDAHTGDRLMASFFCFEARKAMRRVRTRRSIGARPVDPGAKTNGHNGHDAGIDSAIWGRTAT